MAHDPCQHEDEMPLPGGRALVSRCIRRLGHEGSHSMPVQRARLRWPNDEEVEDVEEEANDGVV